MSSINFISASKATVPGGHINHRPSFFVQNTKHLNAHYAATMQQLQTGLNDPSSAMQSQDSVGGGVAPAGTPNSSTVSGFETGANSQPFMRADTLSGAIASQQMNDSAQQIAWLQKAELLSKETAKADAHGDTISAAGPDAARHLDNLSVSGNPSFARGNVQDTIQAVAVTVSGGIAAPAETIPGTLRNSEQFGTAPITSYTPLSSKEMEGHLLYPKDVISPESQQKTPFSATEGHEIKNTAGKEDGKGHLIDLLHDVDHQTTVDLGKYSGVNSASEAAQSSALAKDNLTSNAARPDEQIASAMKSDDTLVKLLDEEQKRRMAQNINFGGGGPFGHNG